MVSKETHGCVFPFSDWASMSADWERDIVENTRSCVFTVWVVDRGDVRCSLHCSMMDVARFVRARLLGLVDS